MTSAYDALIVVSFGGPEGPADVLPFLENVLRGRDVPRERMLEVAKHYEQFGGVSPINAQNRALISALEQELAAHQIRLPIYFGNRNWRPFLVEAIGDMARDGVKNALALFTSAFSSYSGCRQYRENVAEACASIGPSAPRVDKIRAFFNHPGFIEAQADLVRQALQSVGTVAPAEIAVFFTAHSIPQGMAANCQYERQLREASGLVAERAGIASWDLVFQSRSGPPQQPWLEPDISDAIRSRHERDAGLRHVMIVPIGFISDHLEVIYDLDTVAAGLCGELGIGLSRVPTVGVHPRFVRGLRELIEERCSGSPERAALGQLAACPDVCPVDCCKYDPRPARPRPAPPSA